MRNIKKQTLTILFWLRKNRIVENELPLYCRVTIQGQRYEFKTNIHLRQSNWSAAAQKSIGRTTADRNANRYIDDLRSSIEETIDKIREKHYDLNIENFKLMFRKQENEFSTISMLFQYHEATERKNLRPGSYMGYTITQKHLLNFVRIRFHVSDYDINNIDKAFVHEFFAYLQGYRREDGIKCNINGALKHIARFKHVMNIALQNEWISRNPVTLLKVHKTRVEKGFLTEKEVKQIQETILKPHLAIVRDIFLFSVYTGCAYVDAANLTNANINIGIDKTPWINYHRQKTGIRVALPLLEPAQLILEKFEAYHNNKHQSHLFPMPPNQVVNRYLKEIAKEAGIDKNITYHMARHTFATTITLMNRIPIETVSKMLGHTNLTTTQVYAKVLDNKVMDDMADLRKMYTQNQEKKEDLTPTTKIINE